MPDVFLRAGEANTSDIRLRDTSLADAAGVTVTPGTASLVLSAFVPTVLTPRLVTVGTASLVTASFAPTVSTPRLTTIGKASLVTSTFAPVVATPRTATIGKASLATATFAPTISAPRLVTVGTASLTLATFAPTVTVASQSQTVTPGTASLALSAYAPDVSAGAGSGAGHHAVGPRYLVRQQPVAVPVSVEPATAHLHLTPFPITVRVNDDDLAVLLAA